MILERGLNHSEGKFMNMIKIIIWGVGEIDKEFCNYLNSNVEIIAYVDTNKKE